MTLAGKLSTSCSASAVTGVMETWGNVTVNLHFTFT